MSQPLEVIALKKTSVMPRSFPQRLVSTLRPIAHAGRVVLTRLIYAPFRRRARRLIHSEFPGSGFVGPYERHGSLTGAWEEQWLWPRRDLLRGIVLDMSTPRYWHEWIYELPAVERVLISDLWAGEVEKHGHSSPVDIAGDFSALTLPMPPESFDTVLCLNVLEHCEDPTAMIRNIGLLLRKGGVGFFWCPYAYVDGHTGTFGPDYWRFGRDGYVLMANRAGLDVVETGQYGDLGKYLLHEIGVPMGATSSHRGVPLANWMVCRRPG